MNGYGEMRLRRINELRAEMEEWAQGLRSHTNEIMAVEADPADRPQTLAAIAQADAAEVHKLSAMIVAEATLAESLGWSS